ncbi:MAG: hypothetical protein GKR83_08830 [Synechococcus sp. s2_metabat2_7]|nr:hypothetical protein [Synechococcus sp. s2_metabat2_7]
MKEPSASLFFDYLQQGMESLKGLNLEGFLQIYPVFLAIFGTFLLELTLSLLANLIHSINQLPLFGGVLQGISELVGLVALVRFVSKNLLLQRKRAELFTRIAVLKKSSWFEVFKSISLLKVNRYLPDHDYLICSGCAFHCIASSAGSTAMEKKFPAPKVVKSEGRQPFLQQFGEITAAACSNQQVGAAKRQDQRLLHGLALVTTDQDDRPCGMACKSDCLRSLLNVKSLL